MAKIKAVEFEAELRQIRSMSDHTYNLTLNIPEYCLPQVKEMLGWLNIILIYFILLKISWYLKKMPS